MAVAGNFENFYFQPNFALMIGKVTNFWENWLKNKKDLRQKEKRGVGNTPPSTATGAYKIKKMYLDPVI